MATEVGYSPSGATSIASPVTPSLSVRRTTCDAVGRCGSASLSACMAVCVCLCAFSASNLPMMWSLSVSSCCSNLTLVSRSSCRRRSLPFSSCRPARHQLDTPSARSEAQATHRPCAETQVVIVAIPVACQACRFRDSARAAQMQACNVSSRTVAVLSACTRSMPCSS